LVSFADDSVVRNALIENDTAIAASTAKAENKNFLFMFFDFFLMLRKRIHCPHSSAHPEIWHAKPWLYGRGWDTVPAILHIQNLAASGWQPGALRTPLS